MQPCGGKLARVAYQLTNRTAIGPVVRRFSSNDKLSRGLADSYKDNVLQKKANRAEELHQELEELLKQNQKRRAEQGGFWNFLKQNSSQFTSIGVSFLAVVFAYQILGMKRASQKLEAKLEDTEAELQETRQVLKGIESMEFIGKLAQACADKVPKKGISAKPTDFKEVFSQEIERQIHQLVGTKGLSSEEKQQLLVRRMQQESEEASHASLSDPVASESSNRVVGQSSETRRKFSI